MSAIDFEYDGKYLSDFGFIICEFDSSGGTETIDPGSKITFNTVARYSGRKYSLTSTQYDECVTATFDICKNCCEGDVDMQISSDEYRDLMRWLNRKKFLPFRILDNGNRDTCWYDASFNIDTILVNGNLYGLELTMETNRPFGYGDEQTITFEMTADTEYTLIDSSDEIGYIYPTVTITCLEDGDLVLTNAEAGGYTLIQNVVAGEVITINGDTMQIETTESGHAIYNDFNYDFPKIVNSYEDRTNTFTSSLACTVVMVYAPAVKEVMFGELEDGG